MVVGFPLFTSLALEVQTSAHGAVVIAVLPAATAVAAVAGGRAPEPRRSGSPRAPGCVAVLAFLVTSGASGTPPAGDLFLLAAVVLCAIGYAEGGALGRELGGARDDLLGAAARRARSPPR